MYKIDSTIACVVCNNSYHKPNTIASYTMKKFGIEYQGFLLCFNEFNCVLGSKQLRKYAKRSLIWGYDPQPEIG